MVITPSSRTVDIVVPELHPSPSFGTDLVILSRPFRDLQDDLHARSRDSLSLMPKGEGPQSTTRAIRHPILYCKVADSRMASRNLRSTCTISSKNEEHAKSRAKEKPTRESCMISCTEKFSIILRTSSAGILCHALLTNALGPRAVAKIVIYQSSNINKLIVYVPSVRRAIFQYASTEYNMTTQSPLKVSKSPAPGVHSNASTHCPNVR